MRLLKLVVLALVLAAWSAPPATADQDWRLASGTARPGGQASTPVDITADRASDGAAVLTLESPLVSIEKRIYVDRVAIHVAGRARGDRLSVVVRPTGLTVARGTATVTVGPGSSAAEFAAARALVAGSEAVRALAHVAAALGRTEGSRAAEALLTASETVAFLAGDVHAPTRMAARARRRAGPRLRAAALGGQTTNECWDTYSRDAIEIAGDYEECIKGLKWYDALGHGLCAGEYVLRSELAFSWLVACNGGFFVEA
jgi:hypothetical protein